MAREARGGIGISSENYQGPDHVVYIVGQNEEFEFYSECNGKPLEEFEQGSEVI